MLQSKLVKMEIYNLGCIGAEGLTVKLDKMLCLVGPNNTGKSTVLRAYELAVSGADIKENDKCKLSSELDLPTVILHVHIPKGMANIDEKWKEQIDDLLIVKSKWVWGTDCKAVRSTWNPEIQEYDTDAKASGLDTVFSSRLPIPFRVNALDNPLEETKQLLTLILQPLEAKYNAILKDQNSELSMHLGRLQKLIKEPLKDEMENISKLNKKINNAHNKIFPNLKIGLDLDIADIVLNPLKQLKEKSNILFSEWDNSVEWSQQGTGSQRALFWALLQVRSELKTIDDIKKKNSAEVIAKKKTLAKLQKEYTNAKKEDTKEEKKKAIFVVEEELKALNKPIDDMLREQNDSVILPSYMLLIDEPEIGLPPNAIRAASEYLYSLADDDMWQVMLTTHSPQFVNPLEDHTTIVRLGRNSVYPSPKTYCTDTIKFEGDEKERLGIISQFDMDIAEMFFGQYPILIEGDTEYTAFEYIMRQKRDEYSIAERPLLVRARGKYTFIPIIKMLKHFKVDFSIVHDIDFPYNKNGQISSSWDANRQIINLINDCRAEGITVNHKVSLPGFEMQYVSLQKNEDGSIKLPSSKDKPWKILQAMKKQEVFDRIEKLFIDLLKNENCIVTVNPEKYFENIIQKWADDNNIQDIRIQGKKK
ncbi:putative ATP-dependent endonuclease of OLD family [Hungatella effluvii]|uniref:Putative ATP-dependent endonuclease of OLD family n=1 Tax=Hungatella effluvii TaxID=1096246 RepID=A0A2V3Y049_9FIRM|nr:TOPRIM nucleotidyl transferase/hydrolase domain-containing protein [Hungatella effluvii]PXX49242.1 putative ATP-dependent endonuclease of OLD family [Hungatella effluvii]